MVTIPISWQLDSNVRPPLGAQWFVACSVGMGVCFAVLGTRHPLVAHLMSPCAVVLGRCLFCLSPRGIHGWNSPLGGVLSAGDRRNTGGCQSKKEQALHEGSKVVHTLGNWAVSSMVVEQAPTPSS